MLTVPGLPRPRAARLFLLCQGATEATRRAAFAGDEPADAAALAAACGRADRLPSVDRVLVSPARCAQQTAAAFGFAAATEPSLRDCDWGIWRGRTLDEVTAAEPGGVAAWLSDPSAAPHGGESLAALVGRVGVWMDAGGASGRVLAVTHSAVIRAAILHALGAPAAWFWRIEAPPLCLVELGYGAGRWSWRANRPLRR